MDLKQIYRKVSNRIDKKLISSIENVSTRLRRADAVAEGIYRKFTLNSRLEPRLMDAYRGMGNKVADKLGNFAMSRKAAMVSKMEVPNFYTKVKPGLERAELEKKYIDKLESISVGEEVEYIGGFSEESILSMTKKDRPNVESYLHKEYIRKHKERFKNGASRIQIYKPKGMIGGDDKIGFWLTKDDADVLEWVLRENPDKANEICELMLGYPKGSLKDAKNIYRVDVSAETVSKKGISIPTGREDKANIDWRPGGRTSPGGLTKGVMEDIQEGDYTWSIVK